MTRAELYERVWQTPMRTLAKEFGVSAIALSKLCHRYAVPKPRAGHWTKVAAGKTPLRPRMRDVDGADEIEMPGSERAWRAKNVYRVARDPSIARPSEAFPPAGIVQLRPTLAGCHRMIRVTADYFEKKAREVKEVEANWRKPARPGKPQLRLMLPRSLNGRFNPNAEGCLDVWASLEHIRWIMLFHDTLFRELKSLGARVVPYQDHRHHSAQVVHDGYGLSISFTEGFSKFKGAIGGRSLVSVIENPMMATDDYTLTLKRRIGKRTWRAPRAQLELKIGAIAREIIDTIAEDAAAGVRHESEMKEMRARLAREDEERRTQAADRARRELRAVARSAQAGRALNVGRQQLEYEATLRVLADLEARFPAGDEGAGLRTWLAVAREVLKSPVDALLADLQREIAVEGGPDWWPDA